MPVRAPLTQVSLAYNLKRTHLGAVRSLVERLVYPRIHELCFNHIRGQDVMSRRDARWVGTSLPPPRSFCATHLGYRRLGGTVTQ